MSDTGFGFGTDVCGDAVAIFGITSQAHKAIEELAELQVAISHFLDGRKGSEIRICQEIADVEITCQQMRLWFDPHGLVDQHKSMKLDRLRAIVEREIARRPDASLMTECSR